MLSHSLIPPTTAKYKDFMAFLHKVGYDIEHTIRKYAQEHRIQSQNARKDLYYRGGRDGYIGEEELAVSVSTYFGMMFTAAEQIQEAEQRLEYLDEVEEDSEEYQHALGELFGAKSMFIALAGKLFDIEEERLKSTAYGESPKRFLNSMIRGEGTTNGAPVQKWASTYSNTTNSAMLKAVIDQPIYLPKDFKF